MRICFTIYEQNGLESVLSYHFGHCPYFLFVDVEENIVKKISSEANPMADSHEPGALPEYIKSKNVDILVTGGMGPRAQSFFENMNIKVITGAYGKIKDILEEIIGKEIKIELEEEVIDKKEESHHLSDNEEIHRLQKEIIDIRKQMAELKSRIKYLENLINK